ncbi:MAG: hypothetical protein H0W15_04625 [Gemmatimonadales bacterium]|nr:hypothetical protein [Gemmatimonadales bacterium]
MSDLSPFSASRDEELGGLLRDALAPHHDAAFVTRVRARLTSQQNGWEEDLARWFWQGLAAASVAIAAVGYAMATSATPQQGEASVAIELLNGTRPGAEVILASFSVGR